jgi:hypothetical protein
MRYVSQKNGGILSFFIQFLDQCYMDKNVGFAWKLIHFWGFLDSCGHKQNGNIHGISGGLLVQISKKYGMYQHAHGISLFEDFNNKWVASAGFSMYLGRSNLGYPETEMFSDSKWPKCVFSWVWILTPTQILPVVWVCQIVYLQNPWFLLANWCVHPPMGQKTKWKIEIAQL